MDFGNAMTFSQLPSYSDQILRQNEIAALPSDCLLLSVGEFSVYCASAQQIPAVLLEIGRLRELAFQEAISDPSPNFNLDQYDEYYHHLFVWDHHAHEVVGAYRFGFSDKILENHGIPALYISNLYQVSPQFFETIGPAIELGRTFVRAEYQKGYTPLLLLWRGFGEVIRRHPQYRYFYGLISFSKEFSLTSLQTITAFFYDKLLCSGLSNYVQPRHRADFLLDAEEGAAFNQLETLDDLQKAIQKIEKGQLSLPVLLMKYLKFDAKLITFGLHPALGNCLDCLCIADLSTSDPAILKKYLGIK